MALSCTELDLLSALKLNISQAKEFKLLLGEHAGRYVLGTTGSKEILATYLNNQSVVVKPAILESEQFKTALKAVSYNSDRSLLL